MFAFIFWRFDPFLEKGFLERSYFFCLSHIAQITSALKILFQAPRASGVFPNNRRQMQHTPASYPQ
jgi:hypothetical protein